MQSCNHFFYQTCFSVAARTYNNQVYRALENRSYLFLFMNPVGEKRVVNYTPELKWVCFNHCDLIRCEKIRNQRFEDLKI